ncbi:hypothetical protein [Lentzea sp. HUAS12]|uniref:hypothetical protein n=1 Tax=Lentzea sp. HUAS12 TaxID=2951806 RepID=UPI00209FE956|nr:hypothetical protein [Lentzea sp. HUAS12]USX55612.1 hypothetical protein ND450_16350 [Lentzea sp. HUAS12]
MTGNELTPRRKFIVSAEIELEVADVAALERAALEYIDGMVFVLDDSFGQEEDDLRAAERDDVADNPAAALSLLLDLDPVIDVRGVESHGSRMSISEIGEPGQEARWTNSADLLVCARSCLKEFAGPPR